MKWRLFLPVLLLASVWQPVSACGFYPYGEELRFCFLHPDTFRHQGFSSFYYSSQRFYPAGETDVWKMGGFNPNHELWVAYCKGKVNREDVRFALDSLEKKDIGAHSGNSFVRYLFEKKDVPAIEYLKFSKVCEQLNGEYEDPWERNQVFGKKSRNILIDEAVASAKKAGNHEIARRYAFLAIRLGFYNRDFDRIHALYSDYFDKTPEDVLMLWSGYFNCFGQTDKAFADFMAAQVFAKTPDKRFAIYNQLYSKSPLAEQLKFAKTDAERANVYAMDAVGKYYPALENLQKCYGLQPKSEFLDFLLIREINKMEDWIFTPYYSLFNPTVYSERFGYAEEGNSQAVLKRVERDRKYAQRVLAFVASADLSKVSDAMAWKVARLELLLFGRRYGEAIALAQNLEMQAKFRPEILASVRKLKALAETADQKFGQAVLSESVKNTLLQNKDDQTFVFAIGRELEVNGNTTDAALLYATFKPVSWDNANVFWRQRKSKFTEAYFDYYDNYFSYMNFVYSPEQVADVIREAEMAAGANALSAFDIWKHATAISQIDRLYDLLGVKYMRADDLKSARKAFDRVPKKYWEREYSAWERNDCDGCYTDNDDIFDADPFFELKSTPKFEPAEKTFPMNKLTVLDKLIGYKAKAENPKNRNRDYYYFLVANCYYNMTFFGNSWMMQRFSHSTGYTKNQNVEGDRNYYGCEKALYYYNRAYKTAKATKFRALCLRMAGHCEEKRLLYDIPENDYDARTAFENAKTEDRNVYFRKLYTKYPDNYGDITSVCDYFQEYFKSRF